MVLEARRAAKSCPAHGPPKLPRNEVGPLAAQRHDTLEVTPTHVELLQKLRVRLDSPSANGFEHLIHPIWHVSHSPIMPGRHKSVSSFSVRPELSLSAFRTAEEQLLFGTVVDPIGAPSAVIERQPHQP
jgi:hypothetical protein